MITVVVIMRTGELVSCEEAYKHRDQEYVCPVCGCPVLIKLSIKGTYYAACMPGCRHDEICPFDSEGVGRSRGGGNV